MSFEQPTIIENLNQSKIEIVAIKPDSTSFRIARNEFFLVQGKKETMKQAIPANKDEDSGFETIRIPRGYILCPLGYDCIKQKDQLIGQPALPSTVNAAPHATNTNPNPTFNPKSSSKP